MAVLAPQKTGGNACVANSRYRWSSPEEGVEVDFDHKRAIEELIRIEARYKSVGELH